MTFRTNVWLKKRLGAPRSAAPLIFACSYDLSIQPFDTAEDAFFRRLPRHDELWIDCPEIELSGCAVTGPVAGTPAESCLNLLEQLCRARHGFAWPTRVTVGGLVTQAAFEERIRVLEAALKADKGRAQAQAASSEIVGAARRLNLQPEPTGSGPHHWRAHCPQTNHHLLISSESNTFGCGYCRVRGGAAELEALVERRNRDPKSVAQQV